MKSKHIRVIKCFCPSITIAHSEKIDHLQKKIEKAVGAETLHSEYSAAKV